MVDTISIRNIKCITNIPEISELFVKKGLNSMIPDIEMNGKYDEDLEKGLYNSEVDEEFIRLYKEQRDIKLLVSRLTKLPGKTHILYDSVKEKILEICKSEISKIKSKS
jgi:hypothetical protein